MNYNKRKPNENEPNNIIESTPTQWAEISKNTYFPCPTTVPKIKPGYYVIYESMNTLYFKKKVILTDELIHFPNSLSDRILKEISVFWRQGESFTKHRYLHRRGYLLYGPQGGGKTCIVNQIINLTVSKGGIVFECKHPGILIDGLHKFRQIEPNRYILCIFEDIDAIIKGFGESRLLSLFNGENQINKAVMIATTNYPEKLDKRIINRPRRFDRTCFVGMPSEQNRSVYFKHKLLPEDLKKYPLEMWINASDNFSYAAMADLIISVICLNNDFYSSVNQLKELLTKSVSSSNYGGSYAGFVKHSEDGQSNWVGSDIEDECLEENSEENSKY